MTAASVDDLRKAMEDARGVLHRARIALRNRVDDVTDDDVRDACRAYIAASYAYQKARFGKVQVKLSVAGVLRGAL